MKRCPKCSLSLTDDNDFCLEDGTRLVMDSGNHGFGGGQTSGEMPTQYVPRPHAVATPSSTVSSPILYLVIGVLTTAVAGVGIYFLLLRDDGKKSEIALSNVPQVNSTASPTHSTPFPSPAMPASAESQTTILGLSPSGAWSGEWVHGKQTSTFTAVISLNESNGAVSGQIVWTLRRHTNPQKMYKTGLTATEYVQGIFDPVSRMVQLRGVRKDDPNSLVILDRYNLSLSEDGRTMSGRSKNGNFVLRKIEEP